MKWLWLSVLTVALDQLTKYIAEAELLLHKPVAVIPGFFNFTLMYNKGAAFSFLSDAGGWQRYFIHRAFDGYQHLPVFLVKADIKG